MTGERPQTPLPRVVERWWNGQWRRIRRDIWLRTDDVGRWQVQVRVGGDSATSILLNYDSERRARRQLDLLLSERGPWKPLTT